MARSFPNQHLAEEGLKTTLRGIMVNLGLALVKGITGVLGHSYALVADAIESTADVFTSLIVWLGLRWSVRQPDADHPYGHGKAEPLAALVVTLSLIASAILIAVQSVEQIITPHLAPAWFTLPVLLLVIGVKEVLFRFANRTGQQMQSTAVKADAWHHRSDALTSLTALVGISIALIGGSGYESADDWAALIAAVIIVYNAYHLGRPAVLEILDTAPNGPLTAEIRRVAATVPGVLDTEKCLVRKMGLVYFADLHVLVLGTLSVREGHTIAHAVKDAILEQLPTVYDVLVHVEPV